MKNSHKTIGNILIILGVISVICAGCLFFFNMLENNRQKEFSEGITGKIKNSITVESYPDIKKTPEEDGPVQKDHEEYFLEVKDVDGYPLDGYLTIPSIDLEMAVFDTWNDEYLRMSLCRYYGSPYTDDLVIAGHNYRSSFGKLKDLEQGDEVYFTDMNGNITYYIVMETEVLDGTAVNEMIDGGWDLSLYTCTYGGQSRLTVRCSRTGDLT